MVSTFAPPPPPIPPLAIGIRITGKFDIANQCIKRALRQ